MDESKPLDVYRDVAHLIRQVRLMERFFDEVVDEKPETREHLTELLGAYMDLLNLELAPYALQLAIAITQLEDAYPQIERPEVPERATTG